MNYCFFDSPIGPLLIAGDQQGVRHICFPKYGGSKHGTAAKPERGWIESNSGELVFIVSDYAGASVAASRLDRIKTVRRGD